VNDEIRIRLPCPDCGTNPEGLHVLGCDQEPCPRCGGQLIGCVCIYEFCGIDPSRLEVDSSEIYRGRLTSEMKAAWDAAWGTRRIRWTGEPYGAAECRAYGFWSLDTPAGPVPVPTKTLGAEEDFASMLRVCRWDPRAQRFVLPEETARGHSMTPERPKRRLNRPPHRHVSAGVGTATRGDVIVDRATKTLLSPGRVVQRRSCHGYQLKIARGDQGSWWVLVTRDNTTDAIWISYTPEDRRDDAWCEERARRCYRATRDELDLAFSACGTCS
jgi:hypothetical protein